MGISAGEMGDHFTAEELLLQVAVDDQNHR